MTPNPSPELHLPKWVQKIQPSALETLLAYGSNPNFISFAHGLPAVELFPKEQYLNVIQALTATDEFLFQYTPPSHELKLEIVKLMQKRGVDSQPNQILLTAGGQQGISLLVRMLCEKNCKVIVEELAYPGILQALEPYEPDILTVATDPETGIDVDHIESLLQKNKIAFIYVVTEGGNPHAANIAKNKRIALAQLAEEYGVPILEDDPYGFLNYQTAEPPIKCYNSDWVFYIGSFSKIFAPSLRTGWIVVPEYLTPRLASLKESIDVNTSTFAQRAINGLLQLNIFDDHIANLCIQYKKRRDSLVVAIKTLLPPEVKFKIPQNGIFLWLDLPDTINTTALLQKAIATANVAFIPSEAFSSTNKIRITNGMRLNFSYLNPLKIHAGITRLAPLIHL